MRRFILPLCLVLASCGQETHSESKALIPDLAQDELINEYYQLYKQGSYSADYSVRGLAYFANYVGFGWAWGCPFVASWKTNDRFGDHFKLVQDTSNLNRCKGRGYQDNIRTSYTFYNFQSDLYDINWLKARKINAGPTIDSSSNLISRNYGTKPVTATISYNKNKRHMLSTSTQKTVGGSFSTTVSSEVEGEASAKFLGMGPSVKWKAGLSITGEVNRSVTSGSSQTDWDGDSFGFSQTVEIPPCSSTTINLKVLKQDYLLPWRARVKTYSDLAVSGFLRWGFHGHRRYDRSRPQVTELFGGKGKGLGEAVAWEVAHNDADWNWQKIDQQYQGNFSNWVQWADSSRYLHLESTILGETILTNQLDVEFEALPSQALPQAKCGEDKGADTAGASDGLNVIYE